MMGNEGNKVGMTTSATVSTTTASAPKEVVKREEFAVPALPSRLRPVVKKKRPRTVLKEETYTDALEKVITRDFFPDLPELAAQNAYDDAIRIGDYVRAAEVESALRDGSIRLSTPATLPRTPVATSVNRSRMGTPAESEWAETPSSVASRPLKAKSVSVDAEAGPSEKATSLDDFHARFTSEDNASFDEVIEKDQTARKGKSWWLHETEEEFKRQKVLKLEDAEKQSKGGYTNALTAHGDGRSAPENAWTYEAKNRLMYYPEGSLYTVQEHEELAALPRKQIIHENTRFRPELLQRGGTPSSSINPTPIFGEGTVGDKAPSAPTEIETVVGGESYQPVPASPALSELQASPLVTWGNVAATPERIGLGEADGRSFRILKTRRREEVAMRLEKKTKRKMKSAVYHTTNQPTPSKSIRNTPGSATPAGLSAAARRLAERIATPSKSDSQLRRSHRPLPP